LIEALSKWSFWSSSGLRRIFELTQIFHMDANARTNDRPRWMYQCLTPAQIQQMIRSVAGYTGKKS